jgi:hypothetical protein
MRGNAGDASVYLRCRLEIGSSGSDAHTDAMVGTMDPSEANALFPSTERPREAAEDGPDTALPDGAATRQRLATMMPETPPHARSRAPR